MREIRVGEAFFRLSEMFGKLPGVYGLYLYSAPIFVFRNIVRCLLAEYFCVDLASFRINFLKFRHRAFHLQSYGHFGLGSADPAHRISLNFFY